MVGCKAARGAHDARQAADAAPGWRNQAKRPIRSREPTCKRHSGFSRSGRGSPEAGSPCRRCHGRGGAVRPAVAMGFDSPRAPTHCGRLESKVGQAPRGAEVADGRSTRAWFRWRAISEQGHAQGTAAGPCRLASGRVGDRSKESRYDGPISVRRGRLATGIAEIQGSGWLAETASGDGVSAACVAGVEEAALSGVAASPEFASGSVWGTATVFGVDGGTVDLSEN